MGSFLDFNFLSTCPQINLPNRTENFQISKFQSLQIADNMKPEMMATIRDYDPNAKSDPITKAWDATQNKVSIVNQ